MGYADEDRERYAYLDLLATALTDHEKNLDKLVKRLEEVSEKLSSVVELDYREEYAAEENVYPERDTFDALLKAARDILLE